MDEEDFLVTDNCPKSLLMNSLILKVSNVYEQYSRVDSELIDVGFESEVVDEVIDEGRRSVSSLIPKVVVTNKCPKNLMELSLNARILLLKIYGQCPKNLELSLLMEKRLSFVEGSNLLKLKMKLSMMIKLLIVEVRSLSLRS